MTTVYEVGCKSMRSIVSSLHSEQSVEEIYVSVENSVYFIFSKLNIIRCAAFMNKIAYGSLYFSRQRTTVLHIAATHSICNKQTCSQSKMLQYFTPRHLGRQPRIANEIKFRTEFHAIISRGINTYAR